MELSSRGQQNCPVADAELPQFSWSVALSQTAAIDRVAASINETAAATGLTPRFAALPASRDGPLHQ